MDLFFYFFSTCATGKAEKHKQVFTWYKSWIKSGLWKVFHLHHEIILAIQAVAWLSASCHAVMPMDPSIRNGTKPYVFLHTSRSLAGKVMKISHANIIRYPSCDGWQVSCCISSPVNEEKRWKWLRVSLSPFSALPCAGQAESYPLGDFDRLDTWLKREKAC